MRLASRFAGVNWQAQQQKTFSTQAARSPFNSTTAIRPLTSDVASFSKSKPRFGSHSIGSVPDTALSSLALTEAPPESSTSANSALTTHRHEISKIVKNISGSGRITKGAQKQLLAASTFAETSTNPEELRMVHDELARFSKQLELHKGGSMAGYVFRRPQITSPGENSMEHRQAALQGRLGTAVALDRYDGDFQAKYNERVQALNQYIAWVEAEAPITQINSEDAEEAIGFYKEYIEELFGDTLSKKERTDEDNKLIKQGYKKPSVQQSIIQVIKNTQAQNKASYDRIQKDIPKSLDLLEKALENATPNIQCVVEAINRAEMPQQAKEMLLNHYSSFITVDLDKLLTGNKAIPQRPTAVGLSENHIAALMEMKKAKKGSQTPETSTVSTEPAETDQTNEESASQTKKTRNLTPEQKAKKNQAKYAKQKRQKLAAQQAKAEQAELSQTK